VLGFLSKTASIENFKECVQVSGQGELWMEKSLTMSLLNSRPVSLSKRQSELVGLLVQGLKNKEIATSLGISEGTVKAYLTTLYEKVGARDRFELALFGLKNLGDLRSAGSASDYKGAGTLRSLVARRGSMRRTEA
jgi:DNA-binding NarL/FixJ family response regulator